MTSVTIICILLIVLVILIFVGSIVGVGEDGASTYSISDIREDKRLATNAAAYFQGEKVLVQFDHPWPPSQAFTESKINSIQISELFYKLMDEWDKIPTISNKVWFEDRQWWRKAEVNNFYGFKANVSLTLAGKWRKRPCIESQEFIVSLANQKCYQVGPPPGYVPEEISQFLLNYVIEKVIREVVDAQAHKIEAERAKKRHTDALRWQEIDGNRY